MTHLADDLLIRRALARPVEPSALPAVLRRARRGLWNFLHAVGRSKARHDMLQLARELQASRPELADRLRRAARDTGAE